MVKQTILWVDLLWLGSYYNNLNILVYFWPWLQKLVFYMWPFNIDVKFYIPIVWANVWRAVWKVWCNTSVRQHRSAGSFSKGMRPSSGKTDAVSTGIIITSSRYIFFFVWEMTTLVSLEPDEKTSAHNNTTVPYRTLHCTWQLEI